MICLVSLRELEYNQVNKSKEYIPERLYNYFFSREIINKRHF